ncbi:MAG: hypothetical protein WBF75_23990 [Pseudonocardiaceae bacterium]
MAVVNIGERLHSVDPAAADPDGLVSSVQAQLAATQRAVQIAAQYRRGLHLFYARQWQEAIEVLERLDPTHLNTAALLARARRELPDPTPSPPHSPTIAHHPKAVQILRHRKAVNAVAFSPDGQRLATVAADNNARIWKVASGHECLHVMHQGVRFNARGRLPNISGGTVAFYPRGLWLATASGDDTARIWDLGSGSQLATFSPTTVW